MNRTSPFGRRARDYYPTIDPRAVAVLLPFLLPRQRFVEPCAGGGDLVLALEAAGHSCVMALDVEPQAAGIVRADARHLRPADMRGAPVIITNPPYDWSVLEPMAQHFMTLASQSWLLLEASLMHVARAAPLMRQCDRIVSVGRLCWFPQVVMRGGQAVAMPVRGTKDYCWYSFRARPQVDRTLFFGRVV